MAAGKFVSSARGSALHEGTEEKYSVKPPSDEGAIFPQLAGMLMVPMTADFPVAVSVMVPVHTLEDVLSTASSYLTFAVQE